MTWVALKSLAERRLRAALTALAIVLGVAMIAGSLILTDTIDRAFTNIFRGSYATTDLVVRATPVVADSAAGAPTVPAELVPRVRALPGVAAAAGTLADLSGTASTATIIGKDGRAIWSGNPTFGLGIDPAQPRFNPFTLAQGTWARGPGQVVIDASTASNHGFAVGDRVGIAANGPVRTFTITGTARIGGVDSLGGATLAVFDMPTARNMLGKSGFDAIQVATTPGVPVERVAREIARLLPATAEVRTGAQQASADKAGIAQIISRIRGFLLAFGAIAVFVGAFVIFNTFSITVAQRSRELATLRTLGASRRQVLRSVIGEAAVIGLTASVAGLGLGLGLARGMSALFRRLGADLPQAAMVVAPRTVVVSLVVGTLVTLVAALVPAIRSTRVAPIAAVREGATPPRGRLSRAMPVIALAVIGLAVALLARGALGDGLGTGERMFSLGGGALALFIGMAMISSRLVRPIAALVGWPLSRLGGAAGGLARQNAVRNPGRTASTAAALMIGLALVAFVSVVAAGLLDASRTAVARQVDADYVVTSVSGHDTLPTSVGRAVASAPGVVRASSVRSDRARVAGSAQDVSGVDPATIAGVYRFTWSAGSDATLSTLDGGGAILEKRFARDHHLAVGSSVAIVTPSGDTLRRTVTGIYAPPAIAPMLGTALVSQRAFDAAFPRAKDLYTLADAQGSPSPRGAAALSASISAFPNAKVATAPAFAHDYTAGMSSALNMLYVLLGLSVLVSLLGMVNTLFLAVHERTRELGLLRAVGMSRRQARRMVRGESVIIALIGAALGLPLGIGMAALVAHALSDWGVALTLPVGTLLAFVVVAIAAGMLAAVVPARRAARLDVLRALQYE